MSLTVTLIPPDAAGTWRIRLPNPPPNLPHEIFVALDGRPYPFQAPPPPPPPTHPINLLWTGATGHAAAILAAVRAVAAGALSRDQAEPSIAAQLTDWARGWTHARAWFAQRGGSRHG